MAKKIKFPLAMKNDVPVKDLNELRENFDLDKAISYFLDGKLLRWLEARYYDTETEAIKNLNSSAPDFKQQLCNIFDVDCPDIINTNTDFDAVAEHNLKLTTLKQYTSDPIILANVDSVAFNQEDLADLLDENVHDIYLCDNSFTIPLRIENKKYIGIGKTEVIINSASEVDFASKKIVFENVQFDSKYKSLFAPAIVDSQSDTLYKKGLEAENNKDYMLAYTSYEEAAKLKSNKAMAKIGEFYYKGLGINKDYDKAFKWFQKAVDNGNDDVYTCYAIGCSYQEGTGVTIDYGKALEWHKKAAEQGCAESMYKIGYMYSDEKFGIIDYITAYQWYNKAANLNYAPAMTNIGILYEEGLGVVRDYDKAIEWYQKAYDLKEIRITRMMGEILCYRGDKKEFEKWFENFLQYTDAENLIVLYTFLSYNHEKYERLLNRTSNYFYQLELKIESQLGSLGYVMPNIHDPYYNHNDNFWRYPRCFRHNGKYYKFYFGGRRSIRTFGKISDITEKYTK